jgi:hypothetical protein
VDLGYAVGPEDLDPEENLFLRGWGGEISSISNALRAM